ncbi:minor capsid protein [Sutcliffiella horikoshii]|uniref:minor capsid protein n=1 Tax=Sutcliffiella horikoshii TaxID=79883 RepID=UPI0007D0953B|nr:minor capsid protein [Sutcliffiella horikoshii]MCM3620509.1 minor capsid protein [Sutcliffiella horikoshii]
MVQVNINLTKVKKRISQASVNRGRMIAANQMVADMNQFVPMDENILRQTGHSNKGGTALLWEMPYAARLFYMPMYNYTTPGTGPRWDIKAKRMFMSDWLKAFVEGADW